MNCCLVQIMSAVGDSDEENTFWMQMLTMVILAGLVGVGVLVKTRADKLKKQRRYNPARGGGRYSGALQKITRLKELKDKCVGAFLRTAKGKTIEEAASDFGGGDIAAAKKARDERAKGRDLAGGMEMLEPDFLVSVVENTKSEDNNDVMMRKLGFNELVRREQLGRINSSALKAYVTNEGNLYGKGIQCEAMKELAKRTGPG